MTSFGFDPHGGTGSNKSSGMVSPPQMHSATGDPVGQVGVLDDVRRAGLDPVGAFGAAAGMHWTLGREPVQDVLGQIAAGPPEAAAEAAAGGAEGAAAAAEKAAAGGAEEAATAAGHTAAGESKAAGRAASGARAAAGAGGREAGEAAGRRAAADLGRAMTTKALVGKGIEKGAGALAATRGARVAAAVGLRMAAMSIPGVGAAIAAGCWALDSSERSAVNNLISRVVGPGAAPDLDAPPEPPRTLFLPLTHDGNRDPSIVKMDQGMVRTNDAAFRFHPDDVWPSAPRIETTSNFAAVAAKVNAMTGRLDALGQSIQAAYTSAAADEPHLQRLWSTAKPTLEALEHLKTTVLPGIGRKLMDGAANGNDAYQAFREVNATNRKEINNSTSGLIPFLANHVNESKMDTSAGKLRAATEDMDRTAQALAATADQFTIPERRAVLEQPRTSLTGVPVPPVTPPAGAGEQPGGPAGGPTTPATPPPGDKPGDAQAKDLASLLRNPAQQPMPPGAGMPTMPSMPTMPGLGGMPHMPGAGASGLRPPDAATLARSPGQDPLKKSLDEQVKDKDDKDKDGAKKPAAGQPVGGPTGGAPPAQPAGHKPGPGLGAPGTPGGPPGAANTAEIGGRKWTFDNPKAAALAHGLSGADGGGHRSLRQLASEAGYRLPPPGQDIGERIAASKIAPGDVVVGPNNEHSQYLGEQDGKAMVVNERNEVKPLDEVAKGFNGPHQGIFRLADDGAPPPQQPSVQQTTMHSPTPESAPTQQPPAAPPAGTNSGVIPTPPRPDIGGGVDPKSTPPGN